MIEVVFNVALVILFLGIVWIFARLFSELINGPRKYFIPYSLQFSIVGISANVCLWIKLLN